MLHHLQVLQEIWKNSNEAGKNKIIKSKDKSAEAAQAYLREHTESLPQLTQLADNSLFFLVKL